MKSTRLFVFLIIAVCLAFPASVFAEPITINWWHAMRSARGKVVEKMIGDFNASQSEYKVVGTNKGNYDETMNAGVAAFRAKKQPHLLQVFEVGTQTMMLSGAVYPVFELMKDADIVIHNGCGGVKRHGHEVSVGIHVIGKNRLEIP